jgi:uncharacterized protein YndB with AHSA1/START domain
MTDQSSPHLVIERIFDAPVELIWQMWTRPEHVQAWYGPNGATIPVAKLDVRVGGERFVCMEIVSPQGPMRMWFTGEYTEVVDNQRLVYTESIADEHGNVASDAAGHQVSTEVHVQLQDLGGRTRMVLTHVGIPDGSPGAMGWAMALDKLGQYAEAQPRR